MGDYSNYCKTVDNRKYNTWCKYTKMIDTYGCGCQHDCKYCYAKCLLNFRGNWNPNKPKKTYISDIINYIELLNKNDVVRLGCMTDCFQPIEKIEKITYNTIQILNQYKINYLIVTKSSLVSSDKYIKIYDKNLAHFQITITTTNDKKSIEYEKAPVPTERIKSIEKLYKLGFDVSVRLSPFVENNIDFKKLNKIKCIKILIEFLKVNHWIRKWFDIDYSQHTLKYGGYENLQLEKKVELINNIKGFEQVSVGEYVKTHHEYFKENVNHNKEDCCNLNLQFQNNNLEGEQLELFTKRSRHVIK